MSAQDKQALPAEPLELDRFENEPQPPKFCWRTFWSYTGPGFLMCIAYLDPGNLEADLQVGAYTGTSLIWVLFLATAMGLVLQSLAARLGIVTGKHLAEVCREHYARPTSLALWAMTEVAIIGADIQEVLGSAIGLRILFGLPLWLGCLITGLDTFTFLGIHYFGVRKLEALFVFLVGVMTFCFVINFAEDPPPTKQLLGGFIPTMKPYALMSAVGLIGAVIMPHNLYLHSALVLSRNIDRRNPSKVREANKYMTLDAALALTVSFIINITVVGCFAHNFFAEECAGGSHISACIGESYVRAGDRRYGECEAAGLPGQCQEIGLADADDALRGVLGSSAPILWGIGLLAAGQSSTMTGVYAGQFVMEGFVQMQVANWHRVVFTRIIALVPAILVAMATDTNETASDKLGAWLNVLQSVQLPFALLPLLHFCSDRRIMGAFAISSKMKAVVWTLAAVVMTVNIYLVSRFLTAEDSPFPRTSGFFAFVSLLGVAYVAFAGSLVWDDLVGFWHVVRHGKEPLHYSVVSAEPDNAGVAVVQLASLNVKSTAQQQQQHQHDEKLELLAADEDDAAGAGDES